MILNYTNNLIEEVEIQQVHNQEMSQSVIDAVHRYALPLQSTIGTRPMTMTAMSLISKIGIDAFRKLQSKRKGTVK